MVHTKRRVFEEGHRRKFVVVVDGTPECEVALFFAARVAQRTNGSISLLHVVDTSGASGWSSFSAISSGSDGEERAQSLFRLYRAKLKEFGFEDLHTETVFRQGKKAEEITRFIEADEDVAVLVLGAASDRRGPGPLVSSLATGKLAGDFPVPIYIVPGTLTLEDIRALA